MINSSLCAFSLALNQFGHTVIGCYYTDFHYSRHALSVQWNIINVAPTRVASQPHHSSVSLTSVLSPRACLFDVLQLSGITTCLALSSAHMHTITQSHIGTSSPGPSADALEIQ